MPKAGVAGWGGKVFVRMHPTLPGQAGMTEWPHRHLAALRAKDLPGRDRRNESRWNVCHAQDGHHDVPCCRLVSRTLAEARGVQFAIAQIGRPSLRRFDLSCVRRTGVLTVLMGGGLLKIACSPLPSWAMDPESPNRESRQRIARLQEPMEAMQAYHEGGNAAQIVDACSYRIVWLAEW